MAEKMSLPELRDAAAHLNNPEVPVETRQRALTSLFVELCDRVAEVFGAVPAGLKRLTEQADEHEKRLGEVSGVVAEMAERVTALVAGEAPAAGDELAEGAPAAEPAPAAPAAAQPRKPASRKAPAAPPPPAAPSDAAAHALAIAGAGNVPQVPVVSATNKPA